MSVSGQLLPYRRKCDMSVLGGISGILAVSWDCQTGMIQAPERNCKSCDNNRRISNENSFNRFCFVSRVGYSALPPGIKNLQKTSLP